MEGRGHMQCNCDGSEQALLVLLFRQTCGDVKGQAVPALGTL